MIVGRVVEAVSFVFSVCMYVCVFVLIKYSGKYVKIYFNTKITFQFFHVNIKKKVQNPSLEKKRSLNISLQHKN